MAIKRTILNPITPPAPTLNPNTHPEANPNPRKVDRYCIVVDNTGETYTVGYRDYLSV